MLNDELISEGRSLTSELESLADNYHVKSVQHDILLWEAAAVNAKVEHLLSGSVIPEHLRDSILLSDWGSFYVKTIPEIAERVERFHSKFRNTLEA